MAHVHLPIAAQGSRALLDAKLVEHDDALNALEDGSGLPDVDTITPGAYTTVDVTVDSKGRIVAISDGAGGGGGGSTWRTGSDVPSNTVGVDGDFYLRSTNGDVYEKISGSYTVVANITGPAGADGAPGADGTNGSDGSAGATGPAGPAPSGTGIVRVTSGTLGTPAELSGDVTTSGALVTAIGTGKVLTAMIADSQVTLAKQADLAQSTVVGRAASAGTGVPTALSSAQVKTLLAIAAGDVSGLAAVATSGAASDVTGLAAVATSGSASDLSAGTLLAARMPALTGDVTSSAGAVATTLAKALRNPLGEMLEIFASSAASSNNGNTNASLASPSTYAPIGWAFTPLVVGASDYIVLEFVSSYAGDIEIFALFAMSAANTGNVALRCDVLTMRPVALGAGSGGDPATNWTPGTPGTITPGNDALFHICASADFTGLKISSVQRGDFIQAIIQRPTSSDTHTGDLRIYKCGVRAV